MAGAAHGRQRLDDVPPVVGGAEPGVEHGDDAKLPPAPEPFASLPMIAQELLLILGDMEEGRLITIREYVSFDSDRAKFGSISEISAFAEKLQIRMSDEGKASVALDEFVAKYKSLQGLKLSYHDFIKNCGSAAIVPRATLVAFNLIPNAPGEYESGAHYVFCGLRDGPGRRPEPILLHVRGRRGEERVHLASESLTANDVVAVRVIGAISSASLLEQIERQFMPDS